jgi:hypothetical protein
MMVLALIGIMPLVTLAMYPLYQAGNGVANNDVVRVLKPQQGSYSRGLGGLDRRDVRKRRAVEGRTNPLSISGDLSDTATGSYSTSPAPSDASTTEGGATEAAVAGSDAPEGLNGTATGSYSTSPAPSDAGTTEGGATEAAAAGSDAPEGLNSTVTEDYNGTQTPLGTTEGGATEAAAAGSDAPEDYDTVVSRGTTGEKMAETSVSRSGVSEDPGDDTMPEGCSPFRGCILQGLPVPDTDTTISDKTEMIKRIEKRLEGSVIGPALFSLKWLSNDEILARHREIIALISVMDKVANNGYKAGPHELEVIKHFLVEKDRYERRKEAEERANAFIEDFRSNTDVREAMREYNRLCPEHFTGRIEYFRKKMKRLLSSKARNFFEISSYDLFEIFFAIRYPYYTSKLIDIVGNIADDSEYKLKQGELGVIVDFFVRENFYDAVLTQWMEYIKRLRSNPDSKRVIEKLKKKPSLESAKSFTKELEELGLINLNSIIERDFSSLITVTDELLNNGKCEAVKFDNIESTRAFLMERRDNNSGCLDNTLPYVNSEVVYNLFGKEEEVSVFIENFRNSTNSKEAVSQIIEDNRDMYEELNRFRSSKDADPLKDTGSTSRAAFLLSVAPVILSYFSRDWNV